MLKQTKAIKLSETNFAKEENSKNSTRRRKARRKSSMMPCMKNHSTSVRGRTKMKANN